MGRRSFQIVHITLTSGAAVESTTQSINGQVKQLWLYWHIRLTTRPFPVGTSIAIFARLIVDEIVDFDFPVFRAIAVMLKPSA